MTATLTRNSYSFTRQGSGMGRVWFRAYTPEGNGEIEYVSEQMLQPYFAGIYNGTREEFERDVLASLHMLRWSDSRRPVTQETCDAFNMWRRAEYERACAHMDANPERYGADWRKHDPGPPPLLSGGRYEPGRGWIITAEARLPRPYGTDAAEAIARALARVNGPAGPPDNPSRG